MNVNQLLNHIVSKHPNHNALIYQGHIWTYQELNMITDYLAAGLLASGVKKGDHIGILSENCANAIFSFLAITKTGAVVCMLNTSLKVKELADLCQISDIQYLMIGNHYKEHCFQKEIPELTTYYPIKEIFDISQNPYGTYITFQGLINRGKKNMSDFRSNETLIDPHDDGMILYSSGTTESMPKAVLSSYYQMVHGGLLKAKSLELTDTDVICCALLIFHIFCIDVNIMAAFTTGATLVLPDDLHTINIMNAIEKYKCTILNCVPCRFQALRLRKDFKDFNISSLRTGIIGGAYTSPEDFADIEKSFNFTLLPGLGQTEAIAGIAIANINDSLLTRSTTVGHFVDHCKGKIADPANGHPLPAYQTGEICLKGPLIMKGYYKRPDLTEKVIDSDGWFHTGDLGQLDDNGYIHYIGRIKELINRGGEKIIPSEIENVLYELHDIDKCKVIGLPDPYYGEKVCACIILKKNSFLSNHQIQEYLQHRLADYKLPEKIIFLDYMPMNATGKIDRNELLRIIDEKLIT